MRIAIIYTGSLRTCEKTLPYCLENIIKSNIDDIIDVFSIIDCNHEQKDSTRKLLKNNFKDNLKYLSFFDEFKYDWLVIQEVLLKNTHLNKIPNVHKKYLQNSGSMIEWYQFYLASQQIEKHENKTSQKYDYIIRLRTDIVISRPINFYWTKPESFNFDSEYILSKDFNPISIINSILRPSFIDKVNEDFFPSKMNEVVPTRFPELQKYIKDFNFVLAVRKNLFFILPRKFLEQISELGIKYGNIKLNHNEQEWFWNSETQFLNICYNNNIPVFNSCTQLEEDSLYKYNYKNYFDNNYILKDSLNTICFICRM